MAKRDPLNYAICPGCGTLYTIAGMRLNMKRPRCFGAFLCLVCDYEVTDPPLRLRTIKEMLAYRGPPQRGHFDGYMSVDLERYTQVLVGLLGKGNNG